MCERDPLVATYVIIFLNLFAASVDLFQGFFLTDIHVSIQAILDSVLVEYDQFDDYLEMVMQFGVGHDLLHLIYCEVDVRAWMTLMHSSLPR